MSTTGTLTIASLKMYFKNKQAIFFSVLFPLLTMTIFSLIGFDKPQTFDIGLVSNAPRPQTQQFVSQLKSFEVFKIEEGTLEAEMKKLREGDLVAVLNVPDDFINPALSAPQELAVYVNEGQQIQAQAVISIMNQYLDKKSLALVNAPTFFKVTQTIVDSRHLKYLDFLLPGLIAMSVMQMSVFSVVFVFVQYKQTGVLKRLLATPMKAYQFVTANVITRLIVSVIQTAIFIAMGVLILKAHIIGSYFLVLLVVILGTLMFLGLGFTLSSIAKTIETVPAVANLIIFPMLFLGGVFFPISGMPHWLQQVAKLLPLTHFSNALREVMTKDAGLGALKGDLFAMAAWAAVLITIATFTFRMQEKDAG